jgi:hypothetical protein
MNIDYRLVMPYLWSSCVLLFQDGARTRKLCSNSYDSLET